LEISDIKAQTPLHAAVKYNHVECARALLEAGADPDGNCLNLSAPIHVATRDNYPCMIKLLINHHADVNGRHGKGGFQQSDSCYKGNTPVYMSLG